MLFKSVFRYFTIVAITLHQSIAFAQSELDKAIATLKRVYTQNAKYSDNKLYYNKIDRLIDVGISGYQIPISADVVYNLDTSYHPPEHSLVFKWGNTKVTENMKKLFPDLATVTLILIFKSKDGCYQIIDAITNIKMFSQ